MLERNAYCTGCQMFLTGLSNIYINLLGHPQPKMWFYRPPVVWHIVEIFFKSLKSNHIFYTNNVFSGFPFPNRYSQFIYISVSSSKLEADTDIDALQLAPGSQTIEQRPHGQFEAIVNIMKCFHFVKKIISTCICIYPRWFLFWLSISSICLCFSQDKTCWMHLCSVMWDQ